MPGTKTMMSQRDIERFAATVRVLIFAALFAGGLNAWLGIATGSRHAAAYAAIASGFVFISPWVLRQVRRGHVEQGLALVAIFFGLGAIALAWFQTQRDFVPIFLTLMGAVMTLVFGRLESVRFHFAFMWLAAIIVVALDIHHFGAPGALQTAAGLGQVLTAALAMGVILFLAWQHFARLRQTLAESQQAQAQLAVANREMRHQEKARIRFLNTAAHELGTPLTPITIQIELLKRKGHQGLDSSAVHAVNVLDRNFRTLRSLVSDLVEGLRTQSDSVHLDRAPFDVGRVLEDVVSDYDEVARASGVDLSLHCDREAIVDGDPIRVRQVMDALVTNAFKFSPAGAITVRLTGTDAEAVVSVKDDGIGIDRRDLPRLFRPFSQVHDPMSHVSSGSGLGLFIARGIVERHGGRIWADSEGRGQGTTVSFALPRLDETAASEGDQGRIVKAPAQPEESSGEWI